MAVTSECVPRRREDRPVRVRRGLADVSRLSLILDTLPAAALVLDALGVIRYCNREARAMLAGPLLGATWSGTAKREFSRRETEDGALLLKSGRWVNLSRQSLDPGGNEILVLTDVSDSRHLAELIERNERLSGIGEMTARLAHQLRTPVASALLYARQIRDEASALQTPVFSEPADHICDRLAEIARMIDEMLCFAGGSRGSDERFAVRALLDDIKASCDAQLARGRVTIALARDGLEAAGNRVAIKGALINLVDNAAVACGPEGRIELGAERISDRLCLTVSDDGPGIPLEIRERLFEPFFTTRPNGTGLGLAVVKAVADAHHGEVLIDSSAAGTTVALCLPHAGAGA